MYNLISKKWWFFVFSGLIIIPGLLSLILWGLRFSIDFTGGSLIELRLKDRQNARQQIESTFKNENIELVSLTETGDKTYLLRLKPISKEQNEKLRKSLSDKLPGSEEIRFETVGPVIGGETPKK